MGRIYGLALQLLELCTLMLVSKGTVVTQWSMGATSPKGNGFLRRQIEVLLGGILEAFAAKLRNERVRWYTDNQNVARIIVTGSKNPSLQQETLAIFSKSVANSIRIEPEWIPCAENKLADYVSRIVNYDDWSLDYTIFKQLDNRWGPHTIDRFASHYNAQLPRFNSRFWNPGTEAVDAFTCD